MAASPGRGWRRRRRVVLRLGPTRREATSSRDHRRRRRRSSCLTNVGAVDDDPAQGDGRGAHEAKPSGGRSHSVAVVMGCTVGTTTHPPHRPGGDRPGCLRATLPSRSASPHVRARAADEYDTARIDSWTHECNSAHTGGPEGQTMAIADITVESTTTRRPSWRDQLMADYEMQQARLRFAITALGDNEEYL